MYTDVKRSKENFMNGVITAYNKQRGFGLISQYLVVDSIYFDIADCKAKGLYIGSAVQFDIVLTKRGRVAKNIMAVPKLKRNIRTLV